MQVSQSCPKKKKQEPVLCKLPAGYAQLECKNFAGYKRSCLGIFLLESQEWWELRFSVVKLDFVIPAKFVELK